MLFNCQLLIIQHGKQINDYQHWWNDSDGRKPCQRITASTSNALQMGLIHKPELREARPAAKARATLETGCPHTVLSQEHGQGETPQGKTVLS